MLGINFKVFFVCAQGFAPCPTGAYLRQLVARGLRVWRQIDPGRQTCYVFVPDDKAMRVVLLAKKCSRK